jgi:hypothetical protein
MLAKMARSTARSPFGVPRITAIVRAAKRSCRNAAKAQKSTTVRGSSGESRFFGLGHPAQERRLVGTQLSLSRRLAQPQANQNSSSSVRPSPLAPSISSWIISNLAQSGCRLCDSNCRICDSCCVSSAFFVIYFLSCCVWPGTGRV